MAAILTELAREIARFVATLATTSEQAGSEPAIAVIGGLAVSVRTEPRFTRNVDLAVATVNDTEAEALTFALQRRGYRTTMVLDHQNGRLSTVRLVPPGGTEDGVLVDLLFASSGIETEIVRAADRVELLPGVVLPVACVGHLMALKLLSVEARRPKDAQDLASLLAVADAAQIALCREAVGLITERGHHRDRDLVAALDALLGGA